MRTDMARTDYNPGGRPFTGRRMLAVILTFFGVIIAVNVLMAWLAVTNFRGVVVDSGFVASQHFNADHARAEAQAARGWRVAATAEEGRPLLRFLGPDGAALTGLSVEARALWPLDARRDAPVTLREIAPGQWRAVETLAPGQWRIAFTARGVGDDYAASLPLIVEAR
jgi:nitrogen fixation protein FixH